VNFRKSLTFFGVPLYLNYKGIRFSKLRKGRMRKRIWEGGDFGISGLGKKGVGTGNKGDDVFKQCLLPLGC